MIINTRKQNNIFGVVDKTEQNRDYTGVATETANVTVDNQKREIRVDVDFSDILGETSNTAYPGNLGAQTRRIVLDALSKIEKETSRATEAESNIIEELHDVEWDITLGDNKVRTQLNDEIRRAKASEQELNQSIDSVRTTYADKEYVEQKFVEYSKLSKRVVDYVDLDKNVVVIDGEEITPSDNVMYLVKDYTTSGEDTYKQYTTIDGNLTLLGNTKIDLTDYATVKYVDSKIENIDEELVDYAKLSDIPDVSSFISSIPSEYVTEEELQAKGFITEHQDLSDYATKSYVQAEISKVGTLAKRIVDAVDTENRTYTLDGVVYVAEPDVIYLVLEDDKGIYNQYTIIDSSLEFIGSTDVDLRGYATEEYVDTAIANIPKIDLTPYAKVEQIPTKMSQLDNDSNYAKKSDIPDVSSFIAEIPEEYITEEELANKGYYTQASLITFLNNIRFIDGGTSTQIYK